MNPFVKLEPVGFDSDDWRKQIVNVSLTSDGEEISYQGYALTSLPGEAHAIEFDLKTSAVLPAEIDIPVWFSSDASVKLFINDELIETFELPASQEPIPTVVHISKDVTKWTESREISRLHLFITYHAQKATTSIPLGSNQPELQPKVIQKWKWSYGVQSLLFFALAWSGIIGLAILILAHLQPLGDTFRFYAVLVAVLTWLAGVVGLPDVARIPLRPMLRRLYWNTQSEPVAASLISRRRRGVWLALLLIFFVLVSSGAGVVIYSIGIHQYYSGLIHQALEEGSDQKARDTAIRQALKLVPWRKEAQILFEKEAYAKRNPDDLSGFRGYIRAFASQEDVKQAIRNAPHADQLPFYLTRAAGTSSLNDPVVWYSSIIVEGEGFEEKLLTNEALSILGERKDAVAEMQLLSMKLQLILANESASDEEVQAAADELRRQLEQNFVELREQHVYQMACDSLAGYYLIVCEREQAAKWYGEEISARKSQSANNAAPLWLRPPDKLILFYMFASYWNMQGVGVSRARCLLENRFCEPPVGDEYQCDFKSMFEEKLRTPNLEFQNEAAWTRRTLRDQSLNFSAIIQESLKKGWRY